MRQRSPTVKCLSTTANCSDECTYFGLFYYVHLHIVVLLQTSVLFSCLWMASGPCTNLPFTNKLDGTQVVLLGASLNDHNTQGKYSCHLYGWSAAILPIILFINRAYCSFHNSTLIGVIETWKSWTRTNTLHKFLSASRWKTTRLSLEMTTLEVIPVYENSCIRAVHIYFAVNVFSGYAKGHRRVLSASYRK